jgi:hypothetical protein
METDFSELRKQASAEWHRVEILRKQKLDEARQEAKMNIESAIKAGSSQCLCSRGELIRDELEAAGFEVSPYYRSSVRISWEG